LDQPVTHRSAIVCLTRGYSNLEGYNKLIQRNRSVYEVINRYRRQQYPLIIWHEGNITWEHQLHIAAYEWNAVLRFIDVSQVFHLPRDISEADLVEDWRVGYRLMCQFHSFWIWQLTREFDYVMRLDEDCVLTSSAGDPIEMLRAVEGDFGAALFTAESHDLTNRTLAGFVEELAAGLERKITEHPYNQVFPYTNFYVTRTGFWRRTEVQRFLNAIRRNPDSLRCRWGDLPVLGVALNLFAPRHKVFRFLEVGYWHASHATVVRPRTTIPTPTDA
jgi:Glycolipid 2-alpha-mannosyltransferase